MTTRNQRAGIDDRWHRRVKGPDGKIHTERSAVYGKVTRWRVRWVDDSGKEHTKVFDRKPDAQAFLNSLTADVQRGEYVDPAKSAETFGAVAEQWFTTKTHRKPKTLAGYRSLLDTIVLPQWGSVPLKRINYEAYSTWLGGLAVDGSQRARGCLPAGSPRHTSLSEPFSSTRRGQARSRRTLLQRSNGIRIYPNLSNGSGITSHTPSFCDSQRQPTDSRL